MTYHLSNSIITQMVSILTDIKYTIGEGNGKNAMDYMTTMIRIHNNK